LQKECEFSKIKKSRERGQRLQLVIDHVSKSYKDRAGKYILKMYPKVPIRVSALYFKNMHCFLGEPCCTILHLASNNVVWGKKNGTKKRSITCHDGAARI